MNDENDPIVLILKGGNYNIDSSDSEIAKNDDSHNKLEDENDHNSNIDSNNKEEDLQNNKQIENKNELNIEKKEEKIIKKLEGEKMKKIDEFFPKNLSPLDFVNYIEVSRTDATIMKEMQNFILENHMRKDNKYEVLEIKTLPQVNNEISDIDIKLVFTKKDLILFCTQNGNILILSLQNQKFMKKISPKNTKNSVINCLDITDDLNELICGYQDGVIEIINLQSGDSKYTNNKVFKETPCIELTIYKKFKNEIFFVASGQDGSVFYNSIKIGLPSILWRLNSKPILDNICENPIYLIKNFDNNLNLNESYIILGSIDEIFICCIEPSIEKLFSIKKPNFIKESVVPDAQVGIGKIPGNYIIDENIKDEILLIISWENIIYFYLLEINKENIINNYKEIGNYISQNNIFRIGFLNSSVVYIIDDTLSIKLIDTQKINRGKINISKENKKPIIPSENILAEIESNHFISPFFFSQSKIYDSNKNLLKTYLYTILENNYSLYIFGHKQIYNITLSDWSTYLNSLKKREDYINLFTIGINLYKNNFNALSNIPDKKKDKINAQKKISDYLRQIISQYVIFNTDERKNIETISQSIKLTIEFCIEIEAVEFLLKNIEPIYESKEYCRLFLEKFTPFVLRDKIEKLILPKDIILNLFELYYKNGMSDNLSHMLLHMNIKSLDNIEIKGKMEELNLITPLIYLYINGENQDYLIPLQKMFDNYGKAEDLKELLINEETNEIDYGDILNNNKQLNLDKIVQSKKYNGHRILWYIRWILTGKKFPYEEKNIDKNIFIDLVPKITYWLLNEKVIKEFLEFDSKNYFMIHKNIFSSKIIYDILVKTSNDPRAKITNLASLFNDVYKLNDIHPLSLVDYLIAWCKHLKNDKIFFYLYEFIISISKIDNIKKDIKIESACFILKNYNQIVKPVNKLKIEYLNLKIMEFLGDKNLFNENDYKIILKSIINNTFDEVKLFLYNQLEDYRLSIEFLLNEESNIKNKVERLFKFINKKIVELKGKVGKAVEYDRFIRLIKDNINNLAKISMKDFYELFKEIFWKEKKEIIQKLYKDKELQYNFVETIIQSLMKVEEGENIVDIEADNEDDIKYLLGLEIKLLCELKKFDDIVPTLKKSIYYPIKECFEYCNKAEAYEACIYLYIKEANYESALNLSTKKMKEVFDDLINNINNDNNQEKQNQLLNNFDKYLNDGKIICENNLQEDLWFELLQVLYSYEKRSVDLIEKNKEIPEKIISSKELNQKMIQEIKDLMEKMSSYVGISRIIEVVTEKNKNAGFKEFRELLIKILNNYDNLSSILLSAKRLLTNLVLENEFSFQTLNLKGEPLMLDKCDKCHQKIDINTRNKGEILAFLCNHCYHKSCVKKKKVYECPLCRDLELGEMEIDDKSLVKRKTTVIEEFGNEKNQVQVNVNISERKMILRLNKFDRRFFSNRKMLTDFIED